MTQLHPRISAYGDHALQIKYDCDGFSDDVTDAVHTLAAQLKTDPNWVDIMTGYDSLVVTFDSAALGIDSAKRRAVDILIRAPKSEIEKAQSRLIDIPVHYGGEQGPDMDVICHASGLSEKAVIEKHAAQTYRVCMMGFLPGFAFLSQAPKVLHYPRRATPRAKVPAGSIGIANWQTGIYGLESPGGWQIIGRTDLVMFDKTRAEPSLIKAGDRIRFVPQ